MFSDNGEVKNLDLVKELYELIIDRIVHFRWVKGHNGDDMNELCDRMAEQACGGIVVPLLETTNKNQILSRYNL